MKRIGQLGAPCFFSNHCAPHLACDVTQHCAPAPRIGEACQHYLDCYDAGAYCDQDTRLCTVFEPDSEPTCITPS